MTAYVIAATDLATEDAKTGLLRGGLPAAFDGAGKLFGALNIAGDGLTFLAPCGSSATEDDLTRGASVADAGSTVVVITSLNLGTDWIPGVDVAVIRGPGAIFLEIPIP